MVLFEEPQLQFMLLDASDELEMSGSGEGRGMLYPS